MIYGEGEADSHEGVGGDDRCGAGEQAVEGVCPVAGEFHLVGDLLEGGLDPVSPFGDDLLQDRGHHGSLAFRGRDQDGGAAGGLPGSECPAAEALVRQQVTRWRTGLQQVRAGLALVYCGGHDAPGPHDAAAQVGPDRQAEPVEPLGVRGVAAESGMQAARAGPAVRAADPGGVLYGQGAGIDLLAVIRRQACGQRAAQ